MLLNTPTLVAKLASHSWPFVGATSPDGQPSTGKDVLDLILATTPPHLFFCVPIVIALMCRSFQINTMIDNWLSVLFFAPVSGD